MAPKRNLTPFPKHLPTPGVARSIRLSAITKSKSKAVEGRMLQNGRGCPLMSRKISSKSQPLCPSSPQNQTSTTSPSKAKPMRLDAIS